MITAKEAYTQMMKARGPGGFETHMQNISHAINCAVTRGESGVTLDMDELPKLSDPQKTGLLEALTALGYTASYYYGCQRDPANNITVRWESYDVCPPFTNS